MRVGRTGIPACQLQIAKVKAAVGRLQFLVLGFYLSKIIFPLSIQSPACMR
jgi:hypothetical protein